MTSFDSTQVPSIFGRVYKMMMETGSPDELSAASILKASTKFLFSANSFPNRAVLECREFGEQLNEFNLLRLPFDNCTFLIGPVENEETPENPWFQLSIAQQNETEIFGRVYVFYPKSGHFISGLGNMRIPFGVSCDIYYANTLKYVKYDVFPCHKRTSTNGTAEQVYDTTYKMWSGFLMAGLGVLNAEGIQQEDIPERKFINAKRAKKGQPLLFGYKLLTIDTSRVHMPGLISEGRSHASPRLHWRRGHVRRLKTGKITIVRPMLVGDPTRGTIDKDYRITSRTQQEPRT